MSVNFTVREFGYPWSILRMRQLLEQSQWFTREQLREYQEERLRGVIENAYAHVPYYRNLFRSLSLTPADIRTLSDLKKLPLLSKDTVRKDFEHLRADNAQHHHPRVEQTSGTSGEPLRFLLDKPSNVLEFAYYWRHWSWAGYRLGMRFAELSSAYFLRRGRLAEQPIALQRIPGRLLLNSLNLSAGRVLAHVSAIRRYRPLFLKGTPSALYYFALFLREIGTTDLSFRAVFATGEVILPVQRASIEATLHCKVYDSYGHMERTIAVSECHSGGYHIIPEYGVLELIEEPLRGNGRNRYAQVIGTSLHNLSMPLLRYEVGDLAELLDEDEPCACGRAAPRIRRIAGRRNDVVVTPEGHVITTLFVVLDQAQGVLMGQFVQESRDLLRIRIVKGSDHTESSSADLQRTIKRVVGPNMRLEIEYLSKEDLQRDCPGKFRAVVSRLGTVSESGTVGLM
jgi:phenylacetate-CoA ligase